MNIKDLPDGSCIVRFEDETIHYSKEEIDDMEQDYKAAIKNTLRRGCVRMNDLGVQIKVRNLGEFKKLLQKATDQVEQLQETLQQVENFKLNVDVKTD